ncbi:MAG: hypothetical protein CR972_02790 [Candidatus Moraniibacteriota bacterium]|nr:MAG: hypothetical protein CR972_02790 [Candidatus Moranbacteria bacterium]
MNEFNMWNNTFATSTLDMWDIVMAYTPRIVITLLVLVIGLLIAGSLGKLVKKLIKMTPIDTLIAKTGLTKKIEEAGVSYAFSDVIGWLVKWFFIIVVILTVTTMLQLTAVSVFLTDILNYIPNVIVAIIVLTVGLIIGNFVGNLVEQSIKASHMIATAAAGVLSALAKWVIVIFAIMAALSQLNIAQELIHILFTGIVAMLAIAGGLAFGLGGKDKAAEWIDNLAQENAKKR